MSFEITPAVLTEIAAEVGRDPSTVRRAIAAISSGNPAGTSSTTRRIVERSLASRGYTAPSRPAPTSGTPDGAEPRHEPAGAEPGR